MRGFKFGEWFREIVEAILNNTSEVRQVRVTSTLLWGFIIRQIYCTYMIHTYIIPIPIIFDLEKETKTKNTTLHRNLSEWDEIRIPPSDLLLRKTD